MVEFINVSLEPVNYTKVKVLWDPMNTLTSEGAGPILGETRIGNCGHFFAIAFLATRHRDMMLKSVTSATLTIFTLCVCKVHRTEIHNASRGLLYLPYS